MAGWTGWLLIRMSMQAIFRLIRLPNLLLIVFAQAMVRYCLILPAFNIYQKVTGEFPSHLSPFYFSLLVLSTIFIAIGGNIINDYFDISIDEINKPGKNIVGKSISEKAAQQLAFSFFIIGVAISVFLAFKIQKPVMCSVQILSVITLYMYSSFYKRRLLIGNFMIAFLSGLSLLTVGLYEPEYYANLTFLFIYSLFAFEVSLIRELIKDVEDLDGDERAQCKTFPVRYGINNSKKLIGLFIVLTYATIEWILITYFYKNTVINFWYLSALFFIPFAALFYLVITASEKKDFSYASLFSKIIMAAGILSMAGLWYYFIR